jgi:hypothetical protein
MSFHDLDLTKAHDAVQRGAQSPPEVPAWEKGKLGRSVEAQAERLTMGATSMPRRMGSQTMGKVFSSDDMPGPCEPLRPLRFVVCAAYSSTEHPRTAVVPASGIVLCET